MPRMTEGATTASGLVSEPGSREAGRCVGTGKRKAPLEGMSGAFGSVAEAVDRRRRSQGGGEAVSS